MEQAFKQEKKKRKFRKHWRQVKGLLGSLSTKTTVFSCKGIWTPKSGKKSGILGFRIRNTAQGIRNPKRLKSRIQVLLTKKPDIRNLRRGILIGSTTERKNGFAQICSLQICRKSVNNEELIFHLHTKNQGV